MDSATTRRSVFVGIETTSFSGATLLCFLLNAHPEIASIGEMNGLVFKNPDAYICSCGKGIKTCEFWQEMRAEMARCGFEFDLADFGNEFTLKGPSWMHRLRGGSFGHAMLDAARDTLLQTLPMERNQFTALVARNLAFVKAVLTLTGKSIFVDTSKDHMRARAFKMFSRTDVRVIHLVRDPRGVTASKMRRDPNLQARQAARQWVRLHTRMENLLGALAPERYVRVRYEDLCRDPASMLRRLYAFCGANPNVEIHDYRSTPHHVVGNPMRLEKLSVIRLDESWRETLPGERQYEIWDIAGPLASRFGYSA